MNILTLTLIEARKIKRSKILLILAASILILWIPNIINADMNFQMDDIGISPENSFFIQGFMGMVWFIYPAVMVICTVLLIQNERTNSGILKMLALPVSTSSLCLAKFILLVALAAVYTLASAGAYYISAALASGIADYDFILAPGYVLPMAGKLFLASLPMLTVFWMIAVLITTPIFSVGAGLASIVPSVLLINTKIWFLYPMCYPFYVLVTEYGNLAKNMSSSPIEMIPWIPTAVAVSLACLIIACMSFGHAERR